MRMRQPVGLPLYGFLAVWALPMTLPAATLTGHILHNGNAITDYTTTAAHFWARNETTGLYLVQVSVPLPRSHACRKTLFGRFARATGS